MKRNEAGFTMVEFIVAAALGALVAGTAISVLSYVILNNERVSDHMGAVFYAEAAAHSVVRDATMANSITADNLASPQLLVLKWTDWDDAENPVYHVVTYSIEDLSGGIGSLKRAHQDSTGNSDEARIASHVYYDDGDPSGSTSASYQNSILTLRVATSFGQASAVRDYQVTYRPNF